MQILNETPINLIADEGFILTNGETYSTEVWLGKFDDPSNWHEIPIEEVPPDEQLTQNSFSISI